MLHNSAPSPQPRAVTHTAVKVNNITAIAGCPSPLVMMWPVIITVTLPSTVQCTSSAPIGTDHVLEQAYGHTGCTTCNTRLVSGVFHFTGKMARHRYTNEERSKMNKLSFPKLSDSHSQYLLILRGRACVRWERAGELETQLAQ